jgi:hypothetical protein
MNSKTIVLLLENDSKSKERLIKFIEKNKAGNFYISTLKTSIYISRTNLDRLRESYKTGGFLPLIPILAAIAAAGSVAGGAAGIASAVNKKKAEDQIVAETKRHNAELEKAARGKGVNTGGSIKEEVVKFVQTNDLDDDVKRMLKKTLKGIASIIPVRAEGSSLILSPYTGSSLVLRDWKGK